MIKKISILCCVLFLSACSECSEIENGEKIGQIIDIQTSGIWVKTWECKIIRSGIQDGTGNLGSSVKEMEDE